MVARARSRSCAFAHLRIAQQTYLAKNNDDYTTLRDPNRRSRASFDILLLITTSADSTTFMDSETEGQNDARQPYSKLDAGPAPRARRGLPSEGSFVGRSRSDWEPGLRQLARTFCFLCDCLPAKAHVSMWSQPSGALISVVFSACSDVTDGEISSPSIRALSRVSKLGETGQATWGNPPYWWEVARLLITIRSRFWFSPPSHLPTLF